jgi:hypothetical protein
MEAQSTTSVLIAEASSVTTLVSTDRAATGGLPRGVGQVPGILTLRSLRQVTIERRTHARPLVHRRSAVQ